MNASDFLILHVDDDPNDRLLLQNVCKCISLPAAVRDCADGDEAIDYLTRAADPAQSAQYPCPAMVLLDLKMPRQSGFEVLTWMRNETRWRRLPVIILTASSHGTDMDEAYDCGANSYLIKPVTFDELVELVESLIHYWRTINRTSGD